MKSWIRAGLILAVLIICVACTMPQAQTPDASKTEAKESRTPDKQKSGEPKMDPLSPEEIRRVISTYQNRKPKHWGENTPGVKQRLDTGEKVIALTFDACGGTRGSGVDQELIRYLEQEQIPATLFINGRWIDDHPSLFRELAANPLFEIANHGTQHRPLSVNGRSVYGIRGTANLEEALDEILENQRKIRAITGKQPKFFRSGTAYYDDVAVQAAAELGIQAVNYDILGDAGGTYNSYQVKQALLHSRPGSIALLHMNRPGSGTCAGVQEAIPILRKQGYRFVKLGDYNLR
ncbi:polysaccharide deacetylase family protein [Kroppenstedtia eburnea]|uniref:Peptidoglycan/xylan/chitin deacetylase, PgdA/CDA1 family n=1 Tax=Kroppenstedtia eburnea TaxID=714067 RepID=A0A1N7IR24_9BACL|nr:polysaccharide deacetylase family protein [Kroppenstedtia eburnea]QKI82108.1 polysaccharide deacetylase family protein [Kroppenstedtia eburnea]SIS39528.1 Peptidoglycan/xylan/chitin deacetylase, PgdA/CDA1 family [Kroppenstedtia eburnea]